MSKSVTKYLSLATLGLLAVSVTPQLASAATTQSYGTQGEVTLPPEQTPQVQLTRKTQLFQ